MFSAAPPFPAPIKLNEILADNKPALTNGGQFPDYVELVNTSAQAQDLTGFSLTDNLLAPDKYFFPAGTAIPAYGFLTVWCESATDAPGLHSGFAINKDGQMVALFAVTTNGYIRPIRSVWGCKSPTPALVAWRTPGC